MFVPALATAAAIALTNKVTVLITGSSLNTRKVTLIFTTIRKNTIFKYHFGLSMIPMTGHWLKQ
jgi:hypothetical protein